MEVLYAILMLGIVILAIMLLILLFRGKRPAEKNSRKLDTIITQIFGDSTSKSKTHKKISGNRSEYQLVYNAQDSINETMQDPALEVEITHVRDSSVHTTCDIQDDEQLSRKGVIIGRENKYCHYKMGSRFIDKKGTFMLKRIGDNYVILGVMNKNESANGIRKVYRGERVDRIDFVDGKATCFVGPIRFDFRVPGADYDEAFVRDNYEDEAESRFFCSDTIADSIN